MRSLIAVGATLLAAAVPGLLFEPVFGLRAVLAPIAVVLVGCLLVVEGCRRVPALGPWRPLLALLAGLLGLAETQLWHTTAAATANTTVGSTTSAAAARVPDRTAGASCLDATSTAAATPAYPSAAAIAAVPVSAT